MNQTPPSTPTKTRPWILIAVMVSLLLLVGYGIKNIMEMASKKIGETMVENMMEKATGGKADVDVEGGNMKIKTDEGTLTTGQTMPKDWPTDAPVYPKAEVQYSASVSPTGGKTGQALVLMSTDTQQQVSEFYAAELSKQGWTISANAQAAGSTVITATKDTRTFSAMIAASDDRTTITLGVGQDE